MIPEEEKRALFNMMVKTFLLEHLANHETILKRWWELGCEADFTESEQAAILDHVKAVERLAKTLDANHPVDDDETT